MKSIIKKNNANLVSLIVSVIILGIVYFFLFSKIPFRLVLSNNLVSGGDTGSHNYVAYYSSKIFPKLKWWSPDWYAGFPFLYFYPPFLYYLVAFFNKIQLIPWNIGLKIATLVGTLLLPILVYLCLKILDFKYPIPVLGSVFSLFFIFLEKFTIYGGNFPSTLAGEFSYSLGFGLFFVFAALLIKGKEKKNLWLFNSLLLSLMAVIHPFSVIMAVIFGFLIFLESVIKRNAKEVFFYLLKVYGLGFLLSAFWSLPFLMLLPYTAKMNWTRTIKLDELFPSTLIIFEIIAVLTIIFSLFFKEKRKKILVFILILIAALVPYFVLNNSSIWNTRFLPFFLMTMIIISAIGVGTGYQFLQEKTAKLFQRKKIFINEFIFSLFLIVTSYFLIFGYLNSTISFIPFWLKWNYEGFEAKGEWNKVVELNEYLKSLPDGRVMWEYRSEYDKFGTPRILENLPIWTGKPTFEGLLIESGISSYFHFINQAETTQTPTSAVAGFEYPAFNFENGSKHLKFFGANYFVAYTPEIKQLSEKYFEKLKEVNDFAIYKIPDSEIVEVLKEIDLKPKTKDWIDESISWYKGMNFEKPIVFYQNHKEFQTIKNSIKKTEPREDSVEVISISDDSLTFTTQNLGQPHLIKISYFPGWKVTGAKGPFLISPSFMMVIPFQNEVTLKYGYNFWDKVGFTLSLISVVYLIFKWIIGGLIGFLKRKKLSRFQSN
ncbi:MAG TPA: 6-pyruvoyl-tetrahydropterin synthase-related protein [Candidatus Paceibacterota bacterium]|nr:6-pyruvoyl-tetrahydropterin synthase-related protein [Candidatus Paceibacterota bacterium]HOK97466.1 6-pyruvoyl-tetrahydropterin synthase-related protein [Candidatus Paceibacterota bacterium]HPP64799.1 6-pyruvoyl-tetrahydropterin synthase-related protein [Candidatus Paceibacterota bacterium]